MAIRAFASVEGHLVDNDNPNQVALNLRITVLGAIPAGLERTTFIDAQNIDVTNRNTVDSSIDAAVRQYLASLGVALAGNDSVTIL